MTKWTAPDIASIRGDNSRPLQKIFGSLTEYLKQSLNEANEISQTYVRNGETTALTVGTVVYLDAQQGDRATVKRAFNTSDATSAKTLGVVAELIPVGGDGLVTTLGYLEKVNTSAFTAGQTLYLGATAGTFTATKPVAPNHMVYVGVVVRANAGNGIIYVRCQNGYELDEIHDVLITSPTAGQTLSYDAVNSLWKNATFSDGGGLTNLNASNLASGTVPTDRMSGSYAGITGVGTLASGSIPASLLTGTIASARISGSYTGITGVGTLSAGSIPASLLTGTIASARLSGSYTGITGLGTLTGLTVDGAGSPSIAIGDWAASSVFSAIVTSKGYLLLGATSGNDNVYLRSTGISTSVNLGVGGLVDALQILAANSTTSVRVTGGVRVYGGAGALEFENRTGAGEYFGWYSTGGDGLLYSSYLAANVIGVARTTGQVYIYRGVNGSPLYGSYGSFNVYGSSGGWGGITFPDFTSTMMLQNTYFGHYRNNNTWNFYVNNGTFVPSDERYKRDIQPLEHGLNFIREITPVSYDPLTENLDDDPETTVGKTHYGFTTQNILQALSNAGETRDVAVVDIGGPATEETNSDRQYLNYSALIAPMVKAIQELDARLQQLETV